MRGLGREELLRLFEHGHGLSSLERGLSLLAHAWPEVAAELRRSLPLAERDRLLIALRAATFGPSATITTECPDCGAELETELDLRRLLAEPAPGDPLEVHSIERGGRSFSFRLPSTADLEAVGHLVGDAAARALVARTLVGATAHPGAAGAAGIDAGTGIDAAAIDAAGASAIAEAWDAIDPLSEVRLGFACPDCEHTFDQIFEIVSFFFTEIEAHARRLLLDVHALASAYGWTEAEVLALGETRRRLYVEMVS